jgi:putative transposase
MRVQLKNTMPAVPNILVSAHRPKYNTSVERLQGYKFELMPDGEQVRDIRRFAGSCRFVFNRALAQQNEQRKIAGKKQGGYADLCKLLTGWRNDPATPWLAQCPIHPIQQALKNLETAWTNHFESLKKLKRGEIKPYQLVEPPQFRKKGQDESFRYPDPKQFRLERGNSRIFLPKLGWLRYRNSREVEGELRNVTVSVSGGKYFISIQTRREVPQPVHPSTSRVGIDVGIARFATLSDGTYIEPLNSFKKHEDHLKRYQRMMARRQKFSNNWKKAKAKVQKVHRRIANVRRDFLHKASTTISKNHTVVIVEDLEIKNMSRSAKGTKEQPGRNVRAKSGLNRSILDQGWGEFRRQLAYKLEWRGGRLVAGPPHHTSQTCPECNHVSAENRRTQARFLCVKCGYENNADVVGAINVKRAGQARIACEVNGAVRPSAAGTRRGEALCAAR